MIQSIRMNGWPSVTTRTSTRQPVADGIDADEADHPLASIDDHTELDARAQHGRERVAQRRLELDGRRAGKGGIFLDRPVAGQRMPIEPSDGTLVAVDEEREGELRAPIEAPSDLGPVLADADDERLDADQVADSSERESLQAAIGAHEALDELGCRVGQDLRWRVVLGQDPAALEDRDAVGHLDRLVHVMGHEHDRLADLLLEPQELVLEAFAPDRVDRAERLVHEHDRRIRGEGASHADALALAAGELARISVTVGRLEPDEVEQLVRPRADALGRPAQEARHDPDVLGDGEVRKEADLLDDVADASPKLDRGQAHDVAPIDRDPAARRLDEPVDHLHGRRLSAA